MSAYIRQPEKTVAHCPCCSWVNIYFADPNKRLSHRMRAWIGLHIHYLRAHLKGVQS